MRVQVKSARGSRYGRETESGATAVLTAVLAIMLIGLSSFTLDFGRAYVSKRNLQAGADAGSLAAAAYYSDKAGTCSSLRANTSYATAARLRAADILEESRRAASIDAFTIGCNSQGELTVDMTTRGSTPVVFGGVYGASSITTRRQAQATVEVPPRIGRQLRPYMLCTKTLPNPVPSSVVKVDFPGAAGQSGDCPTANTPGNWWTINCPEDGSNSNAVLEENTRNGCSDPVEIVSGQPPVQPAAVDNLDLTAALLAGCVSGADADCLNAVTGNISGAGIWDAWNGLLGLSIVVPVFCGEPSCVPAAVSPDSGNNVNYPVHRFAAVVVCGYHWGSGSQKQGISTTGACAGNTQNVTAGGNNDNYLLLKFTHIQVSGSILDGVCPLDDPTCDGGARQVRLTQ